MLLLILLFPLLGFLVSILFGRFLGSKGVEILTTTFVGVSFFLSIYEFFFVSFKQTVVIYNLFAWFSSTIIFADLGVYV